MGISIVRMDAARPRLLALLLALVSVVVLVGAQGCGERDASGAAQPGAAVASATTVARRAGAQATPTPPAPSPTVAPRDQQAPRRGDGLPTIPFAQLPPQARETIGLIERGGPFPYDRDGVIFGNRERLLPAQPNGYYREYTVITPGSPDRGARRIVAGREGELYYTDDHYESFKRVIR